MPPFIADHDRLEQLSVLRASAQTFAAKQSPLSRFRGRRGSENATDKEFWSAVIDQGWSGLMVPEESGGFGLGFLEMAEVVSALAGQLAPEPFTPVFIFAMRILQACTGSSITEKLLQDVIAGKCLPAVAWEEDPTGAKSFGHDGSIAAPRLACNETELGFILTGQKRHIRPGPEASGFVVSAASSTGLVLIWVPVGTAGLLCETERLADGTCAASITLKNACVPIENLLARNAAAASALAASYDETLVLTSVELLAISIRMLELTLEYLRTRKQFGKVIGSFQSLQHRSVDLLIQQELSAALVAKAITELDIGVSGVERSLLAARVKARCSDAALTIGREAIQLHGAIGVTDEYDLGLYFQRALVLSAWLGNASVQRRRYANMNRKDFI